MNSLDQWLDVAGLMPPLPLETSQEIFSKTGGSSSGKHTFIPNLITREEFDSIIAPQMHKNMPAELNKFVTGRVKATFELRHKLKTLQNEIIQIVGAGNFSALWLDREAFSADSMEHRALITEAVIHIYSADSLQKIVKLFYKHKIPMIPYGEGGGYNMGVTPMAPAVTISARGIDHISDIRSSRRQEGKFEISVGAGVPFKDLVAYLARRGFVLRCDPNTPRAATGGIASTGSNGGRKAFEVILHGRAVTNEGIAACFAPDAQEALLIESEPFLMAQKFFGVEKNNSLTTTLSLLKNRDRKAEIQINSSGVVIPLQGIKASANMTAQRAMQAAAQNANNFEKNSSSQRNNTQIQDPTLPLSTFVGAEGTTGFIYEVTFEIERPQTWLKGARWHFSSVGAAMEATRAIKNQKTLPPPEYFEIISGPSIRRFLIQDFPGVFNVTDEAVLLLSVEANTEQECEARYKATEELVKSAIEKSSYLAEVFTKNSVTRILRQSENAEEWEVMRKPREELPKKLRTKCKTDMEIRTEYLEQVLNIVTLTQPSARAEQKQDVLFGHLTPNHTAIMHWNIGGFDLYDEEQADIAWDYLENVIGQAQNLAPANDKYGSAQFTGEHGVAGKAPFLWLNYIAPSDYDRMCAVKDSLDPLNLFNPETLFLRTSYSRALRARLMNTSNQLLLKTRSDSYALLKAQNAMRSTALEADEIIDAENFAIDEGLRCTRCNSCKICPVIDAEHDLAQLNNGKNASPVLPSKRNILMFMERMAMVRRGARAAGDAQHMSAVETATRQMFAASQELLKKCFYCRKCDKACPVDIQIHPLTRAYHAMGKLPKQGSRLWGFLYERLMGEDFFKAVTYRLLTLFIILGKPFLNAIRKMTFIPDWFKTYTSPPTLSLKHYEPLKVGKKINKQDNYVVISPNEISPIAHEKAMPQTVYIRYRGCMDTFGNPEATHSVDRYLTENLGIRFVDLEKKMCCGFPFEADGLHQRARQSQVLSLIEIAKCAASVVKSHTLMHSPKLETNELQIFNSQALQLVVFSNCPTCCEAIREMHAMLADDILRERIRIGAGLPSSFNLKNLNFTIKDTAEMAVDLLLKLENHTQKLPKFDKTVGLKVPCHNTTAATAAQLKLLNMYYKGVASYDRCCGLSGTARLKHPKIGTRISEKLFEQIREAPPQVVVSGCPSCRDGVKMQKEILNAKNDPVAEFEVTGIFEQIMKDSANIHVYKGQKL